MSYSLLPKLSHMHIISCCTMGLRFYLALSVIIVIIFLRFYLFIFRRERREKERERNISVWLPLACPLLGTWLATHAWALTGNWKDDTLVRRPALHPLSHTSQGIIVIIFILLKYSGSQSFWSRAPLYIICWYK